MSESQFKNRQTVLQNKRRRRSSIKRCIHRARKRPIIDDLTPKGSFGHHNRFEPTPTPSGLARMRMCTDNRK